MKNGYMNKFLSRGLFLLVFWATLPGCFAMFKGCTQKGVDEGSSPISPKSPVPSGQKNQQGKNQPKQPQETNKAVAQAQNPQLQEGKEKALQLGYKMQGGSVYKKLGLIAKGALKKNINILEDPTSPHGKQEQAIQGINNVADKHEVRLEVQQDPKVLQNTAHHSIGIDVNAECGIKRGKDKVGYGAIARLGFGFAVFNKNQPSKKKSSENDLQISDTKNRFSVTGTATLFMSLYDKVALGPVLGLKWSTLHLAKGFERSNILSIPVGLEVIAVASDNLSVVLTYRYEICVWKSKILNGVKCGNHYVGLSCSCKLYSAKSGFYVAANAGLNYNCRKFKFDGKGADAYKDLIAKFENVSGSDKKQDANEAVSPTATHKKKGK